MSIIPRGVKNVLRNPFRLILVVLLLGVSLMFVAAMVSLNDSAQQELETVHQKIGTSITINYATNDAGGITQNTQGNQNNNSKQNGSPPNQNGGFGPGSGNGNGGGVIFQRQVQTPMPNSDVNKVKSVAGIASVEETLTQTDSDGKLQTASLQRPDGQSMSIPARIDGISKGSTHFTLNGSALTIVSGRNLKDSDDNANVAVISQTLASKNNLKVNSTFTIKSTTITVIGIYKSQNQFVDSTLILPLATVQRIYSVTGVSSITAYAQSYEQVSTVASKLRSALGSKYDVTTEDAIYSSTIDAINVAKNSIQLALIVSIVTAAAVIVFAVFILVRERTTEIGTLKAIGASHWQVVRQFWSEVLTLSLLSSILGVALLAFVGPVISQKFDISSPTQTASSFQANAGGRPGGFGGGNQSGFPGGRFFGGVQAQLSNIHLATATLNLQTLLIIIGLGMALAIVTSIIPALYVARIKPAVVLRRG